MPQIEFRLGTAAPQVYACGLLRSAVGRGARLLVRVAPSQLEAFDALLWTFAAQDFIAHCRLGDPLQPRSPVVLTDRDDVADVEVRDCLLNLSPSPFSGWQTWPRLIEVVGADAAQRQAARQRWRHYRDAGFQPTTSEIAA